MRLDWAAFAPWPALAGGALIGLAAVLLMLGAGRIAGISGIAGGLLPPRAGAGWRLCFLLGLAASPWVYRLAAGMPAIHVQAGAGTLAAAGLLVGLGTRYASGCTSGHGVCGLARGSARSFAATAAFMAAGFATVYAVRHAWAGG